MTFSDSRPAVPGDRRRFILSVGALAALPLAGCGGGGSNSAALQVPSSAAGSDPLVDTTSGKLRGRRTGEVLSFLGVPYAQPPVGALRLRSPQPFRPQVGEFDAGTFGAASIQTLPPYVTWIYPKPATQSEDCLTLNVWAPSQQAKAPVVVWLHGGAWRTGATSMPLMNGEALARQGLVVVTANFRLGVLGMLSHPGLLDPDSGTQANWQLQDQIAVLQWVRQNAQAFGGDPNNVCLIGQSAGGTNAAILAQNPAARACFQKAVLLSPAGTPAPTGFTLADAAAYTEALAARLQTTPLGLRDVPAQTLHAAELALNALALPGGITSGKGLRAAPIVDGQICLSDWTRTAWPQDLPVVITNTLTEASFFLDAYDPLTHAMLTPPLPTDRAALQALVLPQVAGSQVAADSVIDAYDNAAVHEGRSNAPGDLWIEIYGDRLLRNFSVRYAAKVAADGGNVRYGTYAHAVKAPGRGVPHCAELPMLFGTFGLDYYKDKVGSDAPEVRLSASLMSAVVSFARESEARFSADVAWPRYATTTGSAVSMGQQGSADVVTGPVPKLAQLGVWDSLLGY